MINHMEKATKIGEITCVRDATTGDYSLSLHGAIAALAAENERLHITIDYLREKIESLGSEPDLCTLGTTLGTA